MSESARTLHDTSSRVMDSAQKTGFALMKANYVERDAPELLGGKIQGLAPEARDIAVSLRDSISARFESLRFHHMLMERLQQGRREHLNAGRGTTDGAREIWSASWHAHYLFDDVVFNAASLFDYLGNAVWFGFHGQNHIKKKWNKAHEASRREDLEADLPNGHRIFKSETGRLIERVHREFVNDLYGYRSDLIHHRVDGPNVYSHRFWEDVARSGFTVSLPREYVRRFRRLMPELSSGAEGIDMLTGTESMISRIGNITLDLLASLRRDLNWTGNEPLTILA